MNKSKLSKIKEHKIRVKNISYSDFYIKNKTEVDQYANLEDVGHQIETEIAYNPDNNTISIDIFSLCTPNKAKQNNNEYFSIKSKTISEVSNLTNLFNTKDNTLLIVTIANLIDRAYSHLRGILCLLLEKTEYSEIILPVPNFYEMLEDDISKGKRK